MLSTPKNAVKYFRKTGKCIQCETQIDHEIHLFRHYQRNHAEDMADPQAKLFSEAPDFQPEYYVFSEGRWLKTNMRTCLAAQLEHRATAVTKPQPTIQ
jgi:hypothetical protein